MKKLREVLNATRSKLRERAFGPLALAQLNYVGNNDIGHILSEAVKQ